MQDRALTIVMLTCVFAVSLPAAAQRTESRDADLEAPDRPLDAEARQPDLAKVEQQIVQRTNEFRIEQGLKKVEQNEKLSAAAQYFADYMARTGRYGHTADGKQPSARAENHGYDYALVSENIAYQFSSAGFEAEELAGKFTQGWIDSPGHRRNMVDPDVVDTGVAVARSDKGTYYAVQMFGRPASLQVQFSVANRADQTIQYTVGERKFPLAPRVTRTHSRGRPPKVHFDLPGAKASGEGKEKQTVQPADGAEYVVEPADGGGLRVTEQSAKKG